jgi:hypothetical protein
MTRRLKTSIKINYKRNNLYNSKLYNSKLYNDNLNLKHNYNDIKKKSNRYLLRNTHTINFEDNKINIYKNNNCIENYELLHETDIYKNISSNILANNLSELSSNTSSNISFEKEINFFNLYSLKKNIFFDNISNIYKNIKNKISNSIILDILNYDKMNKKFINMKKTISNSLYFKYNLFFNNKYKKENSLLKKKDNTLIIKKIESINSSCGKNIKCSKNKNNNRKNKKNKRKLNATQRQKHQNAIKSQYYEIKNNIKANNTLTNNFNLIKSENDFKSSLPPPDDENRKIKRNKKKFNKTERRLVWQKAFGEENAKGICYVSWCNKEIDVWDFDVGHNIPESKGGSSAIDNLFPICRTCNQGMGNRYTIDEWSEQFNDIIINEYFEDSEEAPNNILDN